MHMQISYMVKAENLLIWTDALGLYISERDMKLACRGSLHIAGIDMHSLVQYGKYTDNTKHILGSLYTPLVLGSGPEHRHPCLCLPPPQPGSVVYTAAPGGLLLLHLLLTTPIFDVIASSCITPPCPDYYRPSTAGGHLGPAHSRMVPHAVTRPSPSN